MPVNAPPPKSKQATKGELAALILSLEGQVDKQDLVQASDLTQHDLDKILAKYPSWADQAVGDTLTEGDLYTYEGGLYRVLQTHDKQKTWPPPTAVSLFTDEAPAGVIPAWQQPEGSHDAYDQGFLVEHNDKIWESNVDANVWEPPEQWTDVTDQYS